MYKITMDLGVRAYVRLAAVQQNRNKKIKYSTT